MEWNKRIKENCIDYLILAYTIPYRSLCIKSIELFHSANNILVIHEEERDSWIEIYSQV